MSVLTMPLLQAGAPPAFHLPALLSGIGIQLCAQGCTEPQEGVCGIKYLKV